MEPIALVSGLIGALLSAGFSYWIRAYLDKRNLQNLERATAYVHLVQVSQLVAMKTVITLYVKTLIGEKGMESLVSKDGLYQPIHKASAAFAQTIKDSEPKKWKEKAGFSVIPVFLKAQLESISASQLTTDQLAKLPRDAVLTHSQFLTTLSHLRGIVLLYISLTEDVDPPLITAENILDQWLTMNRFFEQAEKLRLALIKSRAATISEATILLKTQISIYAEQLHLKLKDKPQLDAALAEAGNGVV